MKSFYFVTALGTPDTEAIGTNLWLGHAFTLAASAHRAAYFAGASFAKEREGKYFQVVSVVKVPRLVLFLALLGFVETAKKMLSFEDISVPDHGKIS